MSMTGVSVPRRGRRDDGRVPDDPGGVPLDEGAGIRQDRQYLLGVGNTVSSSSPMLGSSWSRRVVRLRKAVVRRYKKLRRLF